MYGRLANAENCFVQKLRNSLVIFRHQKSPLSQEQRNDVVSLHKMEITCGSNHHRGSSQAIGQATWKERRLKYANGRKKPFFSSAECTDSRCWLVSNKNMPSCIACSSRLCLHRTFSSRAAGISVWWLW